MAHLSLLLAGMRVIIEVRLRGTVAERHATLARYWAQWNGQTGTAKQCARIMRQLSVADLVRMLAERGHRFINLDVTDTEGN